VCDDFVQTEFEKLENDIKEVIANTEALKRNYLNLTELKHILRKTHTFFDEVKLSFLYTSDIMFFYIC